MSHEQQNGQDAQPGLPQSQPQPQEATQSLPQPQPQQQQAGQPQQQPGQQPYTQQQPQYAQPAPAPAPRTRRSQQRRLVIAMFSVVVVVLALLGTAYALWWPDEFPIDPPSASGPESVELAPVAPTADGVVTDDGEPAEPGASLATDGPTVDPTDDATGLGAVGAQGGEMMIYSTVFTALVPADWIEYEPGGLEGLVVSMRGATIDVTDMQQLSYCTPELEATSIWQGGTPETLPDRQIGGLPATGNWLIDGNGIYYEAYCVEHGGTAYLIELETEDSADTAVFADMLDTFAWL